MLPPITPHQIIEHHFDDSLPTIHDDREMSADEQERLSTAQSLKVRRPDGALLAQQRREKFVARATHAASLAPGGLNAPLVKQDCSDLDGDGERNRAAAFDALEAIQLALYDCEYSQTIKSSNKWPLRRGEPQPQSWEGKPPTLELFEDDPGKAASRSIDIWKSSYLNCSALAAAVQDFLMHERSEVETSTLRLGNMHALALVGTTERWFVWQPLTEWPRHVHVCDPWANLVCPAPDYPKRFTEKMAKWESDGKKLRLEGQWTSPLDERWTSCTLSPKRTVFARYFYADGQFLERRVVSVDRPWERA